jgi:hypothetical protein
VNGNERYILEGIIIVLIAAYIFYENVFMAVILSPYVYIHYRKGLFMIRRTLRRNLKMELLQCHLL